MATIKSYTDLWQSENLAKILPTNSADMYYPTKGALPKFGVALSISNNIPCWSLAALLSVIPKRIKECNVLRIDIDEKDFAIWYDEVGFGVNNDLPDITADNPVDACYKMILKLNELNLL